jgi:hypothetical protein
MLPHNYRFTVQNVTGQTLAALGAMVKLRRWKRASDGSITFEASEATVLENTGTLNTATYLDGAIQDNATLKWEGATVCFEVTAPASSSGPVILYFKRSCDGGTTFDDNTYALEIERFQFTAAGSKVLTFQI